LSMVH